MNECMDLCISLCICVCVCVCVCVRLYAYVGWCVLHTSRYACKYTCMCACVSMHTFMYLCRNVCLYVHVYAYEQNRYKYTLHMCTNSTDTNILYMTIQKPELTASFPPRA